MPRVKGGPRTRRRRKKVLKMAKGYVGGRGRLYRTAVDAVHRTLAAAYRDRRIKKERFSKIVDHPYQRSGPGFMVLPTAVSWKP